MTMGAVLTESFFKHFPTVEVGQSFGSAGDNLYASSCICEVKTFPHRRCDLHNYVEEVHAIIIMMIVGSVNNWNTVAMVGPLQ